MIKLTGNLCFFFGNLGIIFTSASTQNVPPGENGWFGWAKGHPTANGGRDFWLGDCITVTYKSSQITGHWTVRTTWSPLKSQWCVPIFMALSIWFTWICSIAGICRYRYTHQEHITWWTSRDRRIPRQDDDGGHLERASCHGGSHGSRCAQRNLVCTDNKWVLCWPFK